MPSEPDATTAIVPNPSLKRRRLRRILVWGGLVPVALVGVLVVGAHLWIIAATWDRVYDNARELPTNDVGLVLGVSRYFRDGTYNPFCQERIDAGYDLYRKGKIRRVLPSGVGGLVADDQVSDMRDTLIKLGVPAGAITMDGAGDRTLDSVVRAKKVYGLRRVTLITQRFHCYRAIYLARYYGLDAVAYCAADEAPVAISLKAIVREYFAQAKALMDLYILHTEPVHPLEQWPPSPQVPGLASEPSR